MQRRLLLAGTASVALGLAAGQPLAEPTFKLGIQSYAEQGFVAQSHDKGNFVGFRDRVVLDLVGANNADNGLRYGVRLRIRTLGGTSTGTGGTGVLDYDKGYVFLNGAFGNVILGSNTGVSDIARFLAPNDWGTFAGIDGDYANWINSIIFRLDENPVSAGVNSRGIYFSPRFAGFQLGVAFTPSSAARGQTLFRPKSVPAGTEGDTAVDTTYRNVYEVGSNYTRSVQGVKLNGSFFYEGGTAVGDTVTPNSNQPLQSYNVGAQLGYAGFLVGGSWTYAGKSGYLKVDPSQKPQQTWAVGPEYRYGALVVGAQYFQMQDGGDGRGVATSGTAIQRVAAAGAAYQLTPGLVLGLEYDHSWIRGTATELNGNTADLVVLNTTVSF
jgi:predicted porin